MTGGTRALALAGLLAAGGVARAADVWIYYNGTYISYAEVDELKTAIADAGGSVRTTTSSSWPTSWSGYRLVVILLPASGFNASQVTALRNFVHGGGRLVVAGDQDVTGYWEAANEHVDDLLADLGTAMSLQGTSLGGTCTATTALASDQVTDGVGKVYLAASNGIVGGTPLVRYGSTPLLSADQPSGATHARTPYDVIASGDVNLLIGGCPAALAAGANYTLWANLYAGACADDDGDGYGDGSCGGADCDDGDATVYPGAAETPYDGVDQDCDGSDLTDVDEDGWDGAAAGGADCDDGDADVHPGASERVNGVDDDCDGTVDEGTKRYDDDGDGTTELGGDCDDGDASVHPGAGEVANGVDDDCDGVVDEGTSAHDDDGDGWSEDEGDCDDTDASVSPGAEEVAGDGVDGDCDGMVDEGTDRSDDDGDGFTEEAGDCDDGDDDVNPAATEVPGNSEDDDCDGLVDEVDGDPDDADGDGVTVDAGDCDDGDGWVHPGAEEMCDGVDNDCDGEVDEGCFATDTGGLADDEGGCATGRGGGLLAALAGLLGLALRRRR